MLAFLQSIIINLWQFLYDRDGLVTFIFGIVVSALFYYLSNPKNEKIKFLITIVPTAIAIILVVCIIFVKENYTYVPSIELKHKTLEEVQSGLEKEGLKIIDISINADEEWEGYLKREKYEIYNSLKVIGYNPKPGTFVKKDTDVELEVDGTNIKSSDIELRNSKNSDKVFKSMLGGGLEFGWDIKKVPKKMPEVIGLSQNEAEDILKRIGILWRIGNSAYSKTVPEGCVRSQTPEKDEDVFEDTEVVLVISKGKKKVQVPNVVGELKEKAEEMLGQLGLQVTEEEDYDNDVEVGKVISQSVNEGESVLPKTEIKIVISKGKEPEEDKPKQTQGNRTTGTTGSDPDSGNSETEQTEQNHETEQDGQDDSASEDSGENQGSESSQSTEDTSKEDSDDRKYKDIEDLPGTEVEEKDINE